MWPKISRRLLLQELRRGELTIMALAIVLSVTAVLSLSLFSERLQEGLLARSSEFLAADRVLSSRREVNESWLTEAHERNLQTARRVVFNSMAFAGDELGLVDVKAVSEGYPLRGDLETAAEPYGEGEVTNAIPPRGEVWVASALFQSLQLDIGDTIEVGDSAFTVTKVVTYEPDVGFSVFTDSPNVLINYADLAATNLIQPGSRVRYNILYAGGADGIAGYEDWLLPQLNDDTHSWRSIDDGDAPLARSLRRAERFMMLASLLGVVLAATAVAVAAQRLSTQLRCGCDNENAGRQQGANTENIYAALVVTYGNQHWYWIITGLVYSVASDRIGGGTTRHHFTSRWLAALCACQCHRLAKCGYVHLISVVAVD